MSVNGAKAFASAIGITIITTGTALLSFFIFLSLFHSQPGVAVVISLCCTFISAAFGFYLQNRRVRPASYSQTLLVVLYTWVIVSIFLAGFVPMTSSRHFFTLVDAYYQLIWIGLSLCIIFLASFFGRLFGASKSPAKSPDGQTEEKPARRGIQYAVPIVLMALLASFTLFSGYKGDAVAEKYYSEREARYFLKNLASAEEAYFAEFETYTKNLDALEKDYGLTKPQRISVKITKIEKGYWEGETVSLAGGKKYTINSNSFEVKPVPE